MSVTFSLPDSVKCDAVRSAYSSDIEYGTPSSPSSPSVLILPPYVSRGPALSGGGSAPELRPLLLDLCVGAVEITFLIR